MKKEGTTVPSFLWPGGIPTSQPTRYERGALPLSYQAILLTKKMDKSVQGRFRAPTTL